MLTQRMRRAMKCAANISLQWADAERMTLSEVAEVLLSDRYKCNECETPDFVHAYQEPSRKGVAVKTLHAEYSTEFQAKGTRLCPDEPVPLTCSPVPS